MKWAAFRDGYQNRRKRNWILWLHIIFMGEAVWVCARWYTLHGYLKRLTELVYKKKKTVNTAKKERRTHCAVRDGDIFGSKMSKTDFFFMTKTDWINLQFIDVIREMGEWKNRSRAKLPNHSLYHERAVISGFIRIYAVELIRFCADSRK